MITIRKTNLTLILDFVIDLRITTSEIEHEKETRKITSFFFSQDDVIVKTGFASIICVERPKIVLYYYFNLPDLMESLH